MVVESTTLPCREFSWDISSAIVETHWNPSAFGRVASPAIVRSQQISPGCRTTEFVDPRVELMATVIRAIFEPPDL